MRKHRITKKAEGCDMSLLADVLAGSVSLIYIDGVGYALRQRSAGWSFQALDLHSPEHAIVDGKCSCPDNRYRGRDCKHLQALRKFLCPKT